MRKGSAREKRSEGRREEGEGEGEVREGRREGRRREGGGCFSC